MLERISGVTHPDFAEVLERLPDEVVLPALSFPGIRELLDGAPTEGPGGGSRPVRPPRPANEESLEGSS